MARPNAVASGQYFPTPARVVEAVCRHLEHARGGADAPARSARSGRRVVRLLDPCAGKGDAAAAVAAALGAESFGIELNAERAEACRAQLDHVLAGSAFSVRLANGAFSCLWLNPPYDYDDEKRRLEHAFLTTLSRALAPGGLLVFLIPQRRLAVSARYLASHYGRFAAYRFPDPEFASFGQMVLFAVKKGQASADAVAQAALERWSIESLPALPLEPDGGPDAASPAALRVPALPAGDVLFSSLFFDAEQAAAEARRRGAWAQPQLAEQLWPEEERPVRPLMPLRRGHLALLIAAGLLNNVALEQDGRRVLVKGRTRKAFVPVETEDEDTAVEREVIRTSVVVLDLDTGALEVVEQGPDAQADAAADGQAMDSPAAGGADRAPSCLKLPKGPSMAAFLDAYRQAITDAVIRTYPPLYDAETRRTSGVELWRLLRRPLGAQADAIRAATLSLQRQGSTIVVGEMGTGKTVIAAAAAYFAGLDRVFVLCPPHLVRKWRREVQKTVPGCRASIVRTIGDLERCRADGAGPRTGSVHFVICSREQAKLGYRWIPAAALRPARAGTGHLRRDESGHIAREVCCPACFAPARDDEDVPLTLADLRTKKHRCRACGAPLWQADRTGPRRFPLADYVRRRLRGFFSLLILDELHEYKSRGSAQGLAAAALAEACGKTLSLTGTLFGGYSSTLFFLLWRFSPQVRASFGYREETRWISRYGVVERITKVDPDARLDDGRRSKRRAYLTRTLEKPGVSPAVLFHLIQNCVFIRLADVAEGLPPYAEGVHLLPLDREDLAAEAGAGTGAAGVEGTGTRRRVSQADCYRELAGQLRQAVRAALQSGSKRLLGTYLQALLAYPDACTRAETVVDPGSGDVLAHAPALPDDRLYPKERALIDLVRRERAAGRRVIGFVTHTDRRDLTPRLEHVLTREGFRVGVLKAGTTPPERREEWIARRAAEGVDLLLANPRLVQTGLDLIEWPTLTWIEPEFSVYVMRQASRRSWRPGQTLPVRVPFLAYGGTMQAEALALVAAKLRSALLVEGELPEDGLAALEGDDHDTLLALARRLVAADAETGGADTWDAQSLEALFATARREEADADGYLVEGAWGESAGVPVPRPEAAVHGLPAGGAAAIWQAVFAGEGAACPELDAPGGETPLTPAAETRVVSFDELARLVGRPRRRARPVPAGQLTLLGA